MPGLLVATQDGLHPFDDLGRPAEVQHGGRPVTALGRARDDVWAVVEGSEVWRGSDGSWSKVADLDGHRATCLADIDGRLLVGSSDARLFRLAGAVLEPVPGFDAAEGRAGWYTPWGGPPDTRSIANWDDDTYVNVHVGGILRSDDHGETWTPTIDMDADVHHVTTAEGLVLAACAGGLAVSTDRGASWSMRTDGLEALYARAVAVCGAHALVSTSNGPRGGRAALYRAALTDGRFERCRTEPASFDGNIDTYCVDALPDGSFAAFGTQDGSVFASADAGASWDELALGLPPVQRVLVMP